MTLPEHAAGTCFIEREIAELPTGRLEGLRACAGINKGVEGVAPQAEAQRFQADDGRRVDVAQVDVGAELLDEPSLLRAVWRLKEEFFVAEGVRAR